jgi:hypothetical protein
VNLNVIPMTTRARNALRDCLTTEDVERLGWIHFMREPNCGRQTVIEIGEMINGWPRSLLCSPYRAPKWVPFAQGEEGFSMTPTKLLTRDRGYVATVLVPPMTPPPEAIAWGSRFFVRRGNGEYREGIVWVAVHEAADDAA